MTFIFEQIKTGGDRNFGYLVGDTHAKTAVVIDPSYQPMLFVERAALQGMKITGILNTHGHLDHTNGNAYVQKESGADVLTVGEGEVVQVGNYRLNVLATPGHTDDHIVFFEPTFQLLITGDHLFVGKIGGTTSESNAKLQYKSIHRLLKELPGSATVWPGHDVGSRPSSTLDLERETNPFLLADSFDAFLEIKNNWSTYKKEKGLL